MAILHNGLETVEAGAILWRVVYNQNFEKLYTKSEIDEKLRGSGEKDFTCKNLALKGSLSLASTLAPAPLPVAPEGFITLEVNGVMKKVPYYPL